MKEFIGNCYCK